MLRSQWPQLGEPPQVLGGRCEQEFITGTARASQSQACHPENALEVSKEHLDLLPAMARLLVFRRGGNCSCDVPGILVEITRHLAHRHFRAAALLELACIAVGLPGPVEARAFGGDA